MSGETHDWEGDVDGEIGACEEFDDRDRGGLDALNTFWLYPVLQHKNIREEIKSKLSKIRVRCEETRVGTCFSRTLPKVERRLRWTSLVREGSLSGRTTTMSRSELGIARPMAYEPYRST